MIQNSFINSIVDKMMAAETRGRGKIELVMMVWCSNDTAFPFAFSSYQIVFCLTYTMRNQFGQLWIFTRCAKWMKLEWSWIFSIVAWMVINGIQWWMKLGFCCMPFSNQCQFCTFSRWIIFFSHFWCKTFCSSFVCCADNNIFDQ